MLDFMILMFRFANSQEICSSYASLDMIFESTLSNIANKIWTVPVQRSKYLLHFGSNSKGMATVLGEMLYCRKQCDLQTVLHLCDLLNKSEDEETKKSYLELQEIIQTKTETIA